MVLIFLLLFLLFNNRQVKFPFHFLFLLFIYLHILKSLVKCSRKSFWFLSKSQSWSFFFILVMNLNEYWYMCIVSSSMIVKCVHYYASEKIRKEKSDLNKSIKIQNHSKEKLGPFLFDIYIDWLSRITIDITCWSTSISQSNGYYNHWAMLWWFISFWKFLSYVNIL